MINDQNWQIGDIVYWMHKNGFKPEVNWGIVNEVFSDCLIVDYLECYERRLINGIPIDEFESETKYHKLPKGWTYNTELFKITYIEDEKWEKYKNALFYVKDPNYLKKLYDEKVLVSSSTIFHGEITTDITKEGYRIIKRYPVWYVTDKKPPQAHVQYFEAKRTYQEALDIVQAEIAELHRQANLSDEEWSIEQIDKTLGRWKYLYGKTNEEVALIREKLLMKDKIEDLEVMLTDHQIKWRYAGKKKWYPVEG